MSFPFERQVSRNPWMYGLVVATLLSAAACGHGSAYYLDRGNALFARGVFDEAELNFRKAIQKDENNGEAHYRAGVAALKQGKPLAALQDFDQANRLMPGDKAVQRDFANLVLGAFIGDPARPQGLYDRLVQISNGWLARDPQSPEGLRVRGYLAMVEKRPAEAIALFEQARQNSPQDDRINMGLMDALFRGGEPTKAEKVGLDYLASHPAAGDVYDALFRIYVSAKRMNDAENVLIRKASANPKDGLYTLQLAGYYASVRKKAEMDAVLARYLTNPGRDPQVHLNAGDFYAGLGDLQNALAQYNAGITSDTKNRLLYQNRQVRILILQNKRPEALKVLNELAAEHPDDKEARSLRAALLIATSTGGRRNGLEEFKLLVEKNPDDVFLRFVYSKALLESGDKDTARTELLEVVRQNPKFVEAQVALADTSFQAGNMQETAKFAAAALLANPNHLRARMLRASALLQQGNVDESATLLGQLSREVPASVDVRLQLAFVDLNRRNYADAEASFRKLLAANPKEWRALAGLVDTDLAQNRPEKALDRLQDELDRSHGAPQVRYLLANAAMKTGKYSIAIENLRQLSEQMPNSIDPQIQLADVYRLRGDLPKAIATVQKAAILKPDDPRPASLMVYLLQMQNRKPEAKQQARRVLALKPDDPDAMNNLAYLLADTGDSLDEALRLAQKAAQKQPANPAFSDTLGYIYLKREQNDQALSVFDQLIRKYPSEPLAHYHLGMAWYQKGDRARAKSELSRALQLNPPKEIENGVNDLLSRLN